VCLQRDEYKKKMYISLLKVYSLQGLLPDRVVERWGLLMQNITLEGFSPHLLHCYSVKDIPALKGEEITFLVGVSCMKREKMKAL
jgi:hypothetical protein